MRADQTEGRGRKVLGTGMGIFAFFLALAIFAPSVAPAAPAPQAQGAVDGILAAFQTHPLVGMHNDEGGDNHDLAQQEDFYAALVRDPRFAHDVGNVVVEFGATSAQNIIDRFVNGEDVPYTELRKVWTDTLGWSPPPIDLGYVNLFAQIRATNQSLPPAQRVHVWLGEPPVDWTNAKTRKDIAPPGIGILQVRDTHVADLIERQILTPGRKALVIYGGFHFVTDPLLLAAEPGYSSMAAIIDREHHGAIFDVKTYTGLGNPACGKEFEASMKGVPLPSLLVPVRGTTLDDLSFSTRCFAGHFSFPAGMSEAKKTEIINHAKRWNADAVLYLGPVASLTGSPLLPDIYLDGGYLKEVMRRQQLASGQKIKPSDLGITVEENTASPRPFQR